MFDEFCCCVLKRASQRCTKTRFTLAAPILEPILDEAGAFTYHYICSIRVNTDRLSKTSDSAEGVHRVQGPAMSESDLLP